MTLNIIPPKMRARHHETGEWHTLSRGDDATRDALTDLKDAVKLELTEAV